jgi:flagellar protein FliO/FliZ
MRKSCVLGLLGSLLCHLTIATACGQDLPDPQAGLNATSPRDAAVAAMQRARALADRTSPTTSQTASPTAPASEAIGDRASAPISPAASPAASSTFGPSPLPLGQPRAISTPLDDNAAVDASSGWVLSTLSALGVVIGLIFLARWCLGRMQHGPAAATASAAVEVLTRVPVGARQRVMLLRVGGRVIVVGEAGGAMSTLADIDDEQEVADLLQSVSASRTHSAASGFRDLYQQMAGMTDAGRGTATPHDPADLDHGEVYGDRSRHEVRSLLARVRGAAATPHEPAGASA